MAASSAIKLYNGAKLPLLGLGTYWRVPYAYTMGGKLLPLKSEEYKKTAYECTKAAISAGYRHIDTAYAYENEEEVGRAIKDKILDKTVKREDMFITGKLWATHHHPEDVRPAALNSLKTLGLDYLDMYLIHTPWAFRNPGDGTLFPRDKEGNLFFDDTDYTITWKAKRGGYVMLAETPFLEYAVLNDEKCELMLVGAPFMFQGYGLATKRGDPLRKALSIGILRLQETGALSAIKQRWWPEDKCPLYGGGSAVRGKSRVTITTFLGVFFILAGVASLALVVTVVQVLFAKSPCGKRRYKKREQSKSVLQSTSSLSDSKASAPQFDAAIADGD